MASKRKAPSGPFERLRALKDELAKKEPEAKNPPAAKKPPAKPPGPAPESPDDEALLLHRLFAGVQPLERKPGRVVGADVPRSEAVERQAKRGADAAAAEAAAVHEHLRMLVEGTARFEVTDDGRRVEGRRVELPHDMLRKLRRGQHPIDARLDLHGLGAGDARSAVERFLAQVRSRGERCVLVVHGKGEHSPGGAPVLRGEIAAWLSQGPASQHVGAFATALEDDGGEGAVYVLLRR